VLAARGGLDVIRVLGSLLHTLGVPLCVLARQVRVPAAVSR
jgi:hypothetical protein